MSYPCASSSTPSNQASFSQSHRVTALFDDNLRIFDLGDILGVALTSQSLPSPANNEPKKKKEKIRKRPHGKPLQRPDLPTLSLYLRRRQNRIPNFLKHRHILILNTTNPTNHQHFQFTYIIRTSTSKSRKEKHQGATAEIKSSPQPHAPHP